MKAYCLYRLLAGARILSCAHNLMEAQKVWRDTVLPIFDKDQTGPLVGQVKRLDRSTSNTGVELKTGAAWYVRAANDSAARGMAGIDVTWYDEGRHMHDMKAWDAIQPTMSTAPQPQSVVTSNAGDLRSEMLNMLQKRGRKAASGIGDDPIRWLEWSADPELDYDDWEAWRQATPTLGRRTPHEVPAEHAPHVSGSGEPERVAHRTPLPASRRHAVRARRQRLPPPARPGRTRPRNPGDKDLWMAFTVDLNRRGAATMIGRQLPDGRSQFGVLSTGTPNPGKRSVTGMWPTGSSRSSPEWRPKSIAYNSFVSALGSRTY